MTGRELIWRRQYDDKSFEHFRFTRTGSEMAFEGSVILAEDGKPLRVDYSVVCDGAWQTRRVAVAQSYDGRSQSLLLEHDGAGVWRRDGAPVADLAGCTDVDLGVSPSTNALPISRLKLREGEAHIIRAAWVKFPAFIVVAGEQRYTRLGASRYLYESLGTDFCAELDVDADGLPIEYLNIWTRIAERKL